MSRSSPTTGENNIRLVTHHSQLITIFKEGTEKFPFCFSLRSPCSLQFKIFAFAICYLPSALPGPPIRGILTIRGNRQALNGKGVDIDPVQVGVPVDGGIEVAELPIARIVRAALVAAGN